MSTTKTKNGFTKHAFGVIDSKKNKISILKLQKMKKNGDLVAWVTAYDLPFAYVAEKAGVDMILVGDSGGMVQLGYQTTNPVTMDEMIILASSARRGAPNTFLIGDMPQGTYEVSKEDAVSNALRFVKESLCDAVKCEGGIRVINHIKAIIDAGMLVMGHLGLTPQSAVSFGGYRVQGKNVIGFEQILEDALALQDAGVFAILLEAMPPEPAQQIAQQLDIPIYGIGAGDKVDGQLVIMHDIMGFYQPFRPWFAKCYIPDVISGFSNYIESIGDLKIVGRENRSDGLLVLAEMAVIKYIEDVKNRVFPGKDYSYPIKDAELKELRKSKYWRE
ncbi:MAG: 3-methyl-2-oxobutanoate hydroxymethyltransferase [Candidatus Marinimicrobia bacterium]|jgi:3-methyl-2-oxobutanoate hydroxymethyltransferase|nr:3-methyl-2-oxobutanoate hydroxymethyltransferase [Candidatus Neomarinimicrobiota bacterium]MBT3633464.1 3-methyl-2-oxobutanoate hydroxymethyltransferase [Candidatus Neomarinimicrobiota bacterium]MBT3681607.1 3-methyl-2-oxobutanoate hydroxymethyltransferase [Candidatus Neomarinimicrobiota bacterium]MBT3758426.1 3-methyl-2-oxobutanoate hydroxymethyltransferase [Candidatus Neomarinimicrobiota bacterium]MBT3894920.1 3-methyl-2-oxobutanoate hydroxymethyltransferase [Candidatus Neomarinimicrobiota